jgi:hypothetical protein
VDVLVDSNIILDVFTEDPTWFSWSSTTLARAADTSNLIINPIIYSEISIRFATIEEVEETRDKKRYHRYFPNLQLIAS